MIVLPSDKEGALLCRIAEGNEAAFSELFYAYHQRLGAYVYRLTESRPATQEIVQDVFVKIWVKRATLANVEHFDAYLFTAARNHVFNYIRNMARERSRQAALVAGSQAETAGSQAVEMETPEEDYHLLLDEAVAQLPPQQQRVYRLHKQEGLSHAEIAERMQLSVETVKKHMSLALRAIRDHLSMSRLTG
ncbi:MAG TPA: RNA polymerase sigma-70 factor [Puia sp.]|nr:RNA polymerase sigma-70 factor [Puia sp.]